MSACRCGSSEPSPGTAAAPRAESAIRATRARRPREGPWGPAVPRDRGGGRRRDGPDPSILGLLRGGPQVPYPIPQKPSQPSPFPLHPEKHQSLANLLPPIGQKGGTLERGDATAGFTRPCAGRLPAAPAITLSRPRSPSTSHEQPGSCVPQDLGKWSCSSR